MKKKEKPVWDGPSIGGVTQSLLQKYLVCRERFRLLVIEGWREQREFSHRMEYGTMFHLCEEYYNQNKNWEKALRDHCVALGMRFAINRGEIEKWYRICKLQFPIYVKWWKDHPDVRNSKPIFHEEVFAVSLQLPESGRTVMVRGKFDGVDSIKKEVCLQENKIKGDINEEQIKDELPFNLQTQVYCVALKGLGYSPGSVRYNVIRRPLSDWRGKFNISQRKGRKTKLGIVGAESTDDFHRRLGQLIVDNGAHFFMRWRLPVTNVDLDKFLAECLYPILENLSDDYEWWSFAKEMGLSPFDMNSRTKYFRKHRARHYRMPFGVYNPLLEGRPGAYAEFLNTGSTRQLEQVTELFPELNKE